MRKNFIQKLRLWFSRGDKTEATSPIVSEAKPPKVDEITEDVVVWFDTDNIFEQQLPLPLPALNGVAKSELDALGISPDGYQFFDKELTRVSCILLLKASEQQIHQLRELAQRNGLIAAIRLYRADYHRAWSAYKTYNGEIAYANL